MLSQSGALPGFQRSHTNPNPPQRRLQSICSPNVARRARRESFQMEDLMDLSLPNQYEEERKNSTPGLAISQDAVSATADLVNMLGTFQASSSGGMDTSIRDYHVTEKTEKKKSRGRRRRHSSNKGLSLSDHKGISISDHSRGGGDLMNDASLPTHFYSTRRSRDLTPEPPAAPSLASTATSWLSGLTQTVTDKVTQTVASATTSEALEDKGDDPSPSPSMSITDILKQRASFRRSGTNESIKSNSSDKDLILLRASLAEKDVRIEQLTQALLRNMKPEDKKKSKAESQSQPQPKEALQSQPKSKQELNDDSGNCIAEETSSNLDEERSDPDVFGPIDSSSDEPMDDNSSRRRKMRNDVPPQPTPMEVSQSQPKPKEASNHDNSGFCIPEETQSNLDEERSDPDAFVHSDWGSDTDESSEDMELRESMRRRMKSAAFDASVPYIPSAWQCPEEHHQHNQELEAKLAVAVADQKATQQLLKEREQHIQGLQRESSRHVEFEQKYEKGKRHNALQIQKLQKQLEDEQLASKKKSRQQALQYNKRLEKAIANLQEKHAEDKDKVIVLAEESVAELQEKLRKQAKELEELKAEQPPPVNQQLQQQQLVMTRLEAKIIQQAKELGDRDERAQKKVDELARKLLERDQQMEKLHKSEALAKQQKEQLEERLASMERDLKQLEKAPFQNGNSQSTIKSIDL